MDNYPDHLAPEFDEGGGVKTPFAEWWQNVRESFPNVPEEVAREWLHRHWSHSPYEWLKSSNYKFERVSWPSAVIAELRYRMNDFVDDPKDLLARGDYLANEHKQIWGGTWLTNFMLEHGDFPSPPILLDNRDGHLVDHQYDDPDYYPHRLLVVEGHTRFELAAYLHSLGRMKPNLEFYVMTHSP